MATVRVKGGYEGTGKWVELGPCYEISRESIKICFKKSIAIMTGVTGDCLLSLNCVSEVKWD